MLKVSALGFTGEAPGGDSRELRRVTGSQGLTVVAGVWGTGAGARVWLAAITTHIATIHATSAIPNSQGHCLCSSSGIIPLTGRMDLPHVTKVIIT